MSKKIRFEAFKYRFLIEAEARKFMSVCDALSSWQDFLDGILFEYDAGSILITHPAFPKLSKKTSLDEAVFYRRGDNAVAVNKQDLAGLRFGNDHVQDSNEAYFAAIVQSVAETAGFESAGGDMTRIEAEREFHDAWAANEDLSKIDVRLANEACTAPEMRFITKTLGDLTGKTVLDLGCGLGEVSTYFAMLGAKVTASDLSPGMCSVAEELAKLNGVSISTHVASSESLGLPNDAKFDVVYAGNMLHHVDIKKTLAQVLPHLAENGTFVSWDPVAYNPIINIYRRIAMKVRTDDEHPLTNEDVAQIEQNFCQVETRFFWLSTLVIFLIMAIIQRRNPNNERYWKSVVQEAPRWEGLYYPLERLDNRLLSIIPQLRWLCWNVVVIGRNPRRKF